MLGQDGLIYYLQFYVFLVHIYIGCGSFSSKSWNIMKPILHFRASTVEYENELNIAEKYFPVERSRAALGDKEENLVVCRYSCLPYYEEFQADIDYFGKTMINSYREHRYIASMDWVHDLGDLTPRTWRDYEFQYAPEGSYVVKGETNSKKHSWEKKMFAPTKRRACEIASELSTDMMIGEQPMVYREYVPLRTFEYGLHGLPITNEWRFFFYKKELLSYGYYWENVASDETRAIVSITDEGIALAQQTADILSENTNFFVIDIAEKKDGGWIVIEINDGQMAGLSENDPEILYKNLAKALKDEE